MSLAVQQISGWKFDHLDITIRQRLCEALSASGRTKDSAECFHRMVNEFARETRLHNQLLEWAIRESWFVLSKCRPERKASVRFQAAFLR